MKKVLFSLILVFGTIMTTQAQVAVEEDFPISQMMERYTEINKSSNQIEGWRVQVMATTDRLKVEDAKRDFLSKHPTIAVDWTHSKPYYRLRAGAFNSKLEAIRLLYLLKKDYPGAYPAKDKKITPLELIRS